MKKLALLAVIGVAASVALAGEADLVGTWKVDTLKIMQMMGQAPADADPVEFEKQYSIRIEMTKDGVWKYVSKSPNGEQAQEGKWRVLSSEGNSVTIETSDDSGQTQQFVLTFESKDSVVASMVNGPQMFLERIK